MLHTGIVVDMGAESTTITPVCDGYASKSCSKNFKVTGNKIDEYLMKLLYTNYHKDRKIGDLKF